MKHPLYWQLVPLSPHKNDVQFGPTLTKLTGFAHVMNVFFVMIHCMDPYVNCLFSHFRQPSSSNSVPHSTSIYSKPFDNIYIDPNKGFCFEQTLCQKNSSEAVRAVYPGIRHFDLPKADFFYENSMASFGYGLMGTIDRTKTKNLHRHEIIRVQ